MPSKRKRRLTKEPTHRETPSFILFAVLYDPENRQQNVRVVIEGPFRSSADAIIALKALLKDGRYSAASTKVVRVSDAELSYRTIDSIRTILKP